MVTTIFVSQWERVSESHGGGNDDDRQMAYFRQTSNQLTLDYWTTLRCIHATMNMYANDSRLSVGRCTSSRVEYKTNTGGRSVGTSTLIEAFYFLVFLFCPILPNGSSTAHILHPMQRRRVMFHHNQNWHQFAVLHSSVVLVLWFATLERF